jgi:ABC-type amino acid transport substrate-binding protein
MGRSATNVLGNSIATAVVAKWEGDRDQVAAGDLGVAHRGDRLRPCDLECGSTTNNLERQKQVAFSPIIFVAGTKLLVKRGSPIRSYRDLAGKTVVVTAGTTNEKAMQELRGASRSISHLEIARDHAQSFASWKPARPTPSPPTTCCSMA